MLYEVITSVMALKKIRRIPIVEGKTLVGIVSHGDVHRAIFGMRGRAALGMKVERTDDLPAEKHK